MVHLVLGDTLPLEDINLHSADSSTIGEGDHTDIVCFSTDSSNAWKEFLQVLFVVRNVYALIALYFSWTIATDNIRGKDTGHTGFEVVCAYIAFTYGIYVILTDYFYCAGASNEGYNDAVRP